MSGSARDISPSDTAPRVPLAGLEAGSVARITGVRGGRRAVRRFTSLGLRVGADVTVSQRRANGVVVISGNTRIALGPEMASQIEVEPIAAEAAG